MKWIAIGNTQPMHGRRIAVTDGTYIAQMEWDKRYLLDDITIGKNVRSLPKDDDDEEENPNSETNLGNHITHWVYICSFGSLISHIAENKIVAKHYYGKDRAKTCNKCNKVWDAHLYTKCSHCYGENFLSASKRRRLQQGLVSKR